MVNPINPMIVPYDTIWPRQALSGNHGNHGSPIPAMMRRWTGSFFFALPQRSPHQNENRGTYHTILVALRSIYIYIYICIWHEYNYIILWHNEFICGYTYIDTHLKPTMTFWYHVTYWQHGWLTKHPVIYTDHLSGPSRDEVMAPRIQNVMFREKIHLSLCIYIYYIYKCKYIHVYRCTHIHTK